VPPGTPGNATGANGFASIDRDGRNGTNGGVGGATVVVTTYAQLVEAVSDHNPRIVQVQGTISGAGPMVDVGSNKTIVGVGSNATLEGFGLNISGWRPEHVTYYKSDWCEAKHAGLFPYTRNVIVRNLTIQNYADDGINVACWSHHVWLDHNTILPGVDGALDIKRGSDWITVSWNKVINTDKTMLLGHDDSNGPQDIGHLHVTYHHNWFQNTVQRHPRVRFGQAHVYNNWADGTKNYFIGSSLQSDIYADANYLNMTGFATQEQGSASGKLTWDASNLIIKAKAPEINTGNAFDPKSYYSYTVDAPANIPTILTNGAGAGKIVP
jgi:pectate lyase